MLPPARRPIEVRVAGGKSAQEIVFDGRRVEVRL
jgi:hypothetical protein